MKQKLTPDIIASIEEQAVRLCEIKSRRRAHAKKIHRQPTDPAKTRDVLNIWGLRHRSPESLKQTT